MTVETRSIYSGPVRRGLERIEPLVSKIAALVIRIAALETATATTPWTGVTFQNGWANYGAPYQTAQYRKVGDVSAVRGLIKSGSLGAVAFTLPVGYRPPANIQLVVRAAAGDNYVEVQPTGAVYVFAVSNAAVSLGFSFSVTP